MSARDEVIDRIADSISDLSEARMIAKVVAVPPRRFPQAGDMRSFWQAVVVVLEEHHGPRAFATLFAAIGKAYPRTVAECEELLAADPAHGAASTRSPRPVRVVRSGQVLGRIVGRSAQAFVVQIGARTRDEPPPRLEIVGEDPSDTIDRGATALENRDQAQWWEIPIAFTRAGWRSRTLSLRVVDEPDAARATLSLVDARVLVIARLALVACALLATWVFVAAFAGSAALALALVPLALAAGGAASFAPRLAPRVPPRALLAAAAVAFALAWLPGLAMVRLDNQTGDTIVVGAPIARGEVASVRAATADALADTYCMTAPERSLGLALFLPRRTVKKTAPRWTVVEDTFAPEVIARKLEVEGGTRADRVVTVHVAPPDCARASARASLRDYLAATIRIPYGWTLSSITLDGREMLKLVHAFGEPRLDHATTLVETDRGNLWCESGSPVILEPLPEIPTAKELELTSEGEPGTSSHWVSTSTRAWRCRIKARTNSIILGTTGTGDFELPVEMGAARLTIDGARLDVPADARLIKRRRVSPDANLPTGMIALDDGGRATIDKDQIVMAIKDATKPQTFKKDAQDYAFEIKSPRDTIKIDLRSRLPHVLVPTTPIRPTPEPPPDDTIIRRDMTFHPDAIRPHRVAPGRPAPIRTTPVQP